MLLKIVLIIAIAAKGPAYGIGSRQKDVCSLDPKKGQGRGYFKDWYYDTKVGKCSQFVFGYAGGTPDENRFKSESECNALCRSEVPGFCFEELKPSTETHNSKKWTYKSSRGQCVETQWNGGVNVSKNIFASRHDCEQTCKIPDLGDCAKPATTRCAKNDDDWYRFDNRTHTCRNLHYHECPNWEGNTFGSFYECNQRCGRFVRDKCKMPIQNMSICPTVTTRYGYNYIDQMCEEFQGCDDGGNSFPSAEMCWKTCAKNTRSPCVMPPDFRYHGFYVRYYYNIKDNKCKSAWISGRGVPGNTNLFWSLNECENTCIANHQPGWRYESEESVTSLNLDGIEGSQDIA